MYRPPYNDWTDRDAIIAFCKAHPFAIIVSVDPDDARPIATHIPVIVNENAGELMCTLHIARANTQWKSIENTEVLLVFAGPHAYISPSGYEELDVPTWNYIAVHMYGTVRIIDDNDAVHDRLRNLVEQHDGEPFWQRLLVEHVEPLIAGIVMMDVRITDVQGKRKMSQNRNDHDRVYGERAVFGDGVDPTRPSQV